ncbi:hypothetical protein F4678DRAFT_413800 [Xylaria arbuscula]|nr:hypothetical protein F4678DRAFT_413800 [Xylaria arbuscula]
MTISPARLVVTATRVYGLPFPLVFFIVFRLVFILAFTKPCFICFNGPFVILICPLYQSALFGREVLFKTSTLGRARASAGA